MIHWLLFPEALGEKTYPAYRQPEGEVTLSSGDYFRIGLEIQVDGGNTEASDYGPIGTHQASLYLVCRRALCPLYLVFSLAQILIDRFPTNAILAG